MTAAQQVIAVVLALVASVGGGWYVVRGVLGMAAHSKDAGSRRPPDNGSPTLRGGTWIGLLERLAITGTVLLGHPEGVAVVVALKGLGRYPEIAKNPEAAERFVIGSLASLVWAVGVGAVTAALL